MNPTRLGPYNILEKIGAGGMGSVYLGRHVDTGEMAAVKELPASLAREEGFIERFAREVDAMRKLSHPNIVKLYESGVDGETYYYAMEYVPGETMMSLLRRERRIDWQRAVKMAIEICHALKAAHDAGIIHRDLKPSNLLISPEGVVKLTDFGVAQVFAADRLTVTGGIIGTAEFMSPEQATGKRATKQSDLYSLGAVLYVLVTGRPPFAGSTAVDVIQKHKFGQFDRPRLIVPEIPTWLEEVICQLLEKDPAKRFPDAYVLARRLEQILRKSELAASDITLAEGFESDTAATTIAKGGSRQPGSVHAGPGPATFMKDMVRAELLDLQKPPWYLALFDHAYVLVTLLLFVIGGGVWWFWPRDISPEEKFARGVQIMEKNASDEWFEARLKYFEPLIATDPDRWRGEVQGYLSQIEAYETTRPNASLKRHKGKSAESESRRNFRLAQNYYQHGDLGLAEAKLVALQTLLENDPSRTAEYKLVTQTLEKVRKERADIARLDTFVDDRLAHAKELADAGKTAETRKILGAIIELYGNDPSAADAVRKAKQMLSELPTNKPGIEK